MPTRTGQRVLAPLFAAVGLVVSAPAQLTWADPFAKPPARQGVRAFYDEPRGRMTCFGGDDGTTYQEDAWSFDGASVMRCAASAALGPRAYGAIANDPSFPGRAVVFGGRALNGSLYSETLRWDDELGVFVKLAPALSPPARWLAGMALDTARARVVLFGGGNSGGPLGDTWEWDGTAWLSRSVTIAPPARANLAMAYDAARGRIVVFGGHNGSSSLLDTWTFDGTTWVNATTASGPGARHDHVMAYDARRSVVVLFGGKTDAGVVLDDVWEWNGSTWSAANVAQRPPARELCTLVWDSKRQVCVLHGGSRNGTLHADVWEWNGTAWNSRAPKQQAPVPPPPSARNGHASAFDTKRNRIVVFGGSDSTGTVSDLWEYDFTQWIARTGSPAPGARTGAGMAYDPGRGVTYLIGGRVGGTDVDTTLWIWNGAAWTVDASPVIPGRSGHVCVFDTKRNRLIVYAGFSSNSNAYLDDVWEYDYLSGWTRPTLGNRPPKRTGAAAAVQQGKLTVFGGLSNGTYLDDTWSWDGGSAWVLVSASNPPARADGAMVYDPATNYLILWGGRNTSGFLGDMRIGVPGIAGWTAPGLNTGQEAPPTSRVGMTLTIDPATSRVTMFGGLDASGVQNDVHEVLVSYTPLTPSTTFHTRVPVAPIRARTAHAAAYDPVHRETLVFGGTESDVSGVLGFQPVTHWLNDTVAWNGTTWQPRVIASPPAVRQFATLAFEARSGKLVLHGGNGPQGYLGDTWLWDGTSWTQSATAGPSPRTRAACASLWPRNGMILFGGQDASGDLQDSYTFDGQAWIANHVFGPGPRHAHAMAYDRKRDRVVLFGGRNASGQLSDTWEYDPVANTWSLRTPLLHPPVRDQHAMVYDAARGRVVLIEGSGDVLNPVPRDQIWEWDGTTWQAREVLSPRPSWITDSTACYDEQTARIVVFGGTYRSVFQLNLHSNQISELWAPTDVAGAGMNSSGFPLKLLSQPALGTTLDLWFSAQANTGVLTIGAGPVQAPVAPLPLPIACGTGGSLYTDLSIVVPYSGTPGTYGLAIPFDTSLLAKSVVLQGLTVRTSRLGACLAVTDAMHVTFQRP